jgi:arylsulfatase
VAHVTDIAPTLFELAGTRHPGIEYQGKPVLPLLQGREQLVHGADKAIGWELGGRKALRKGDWKIVSANQPWGTGEWELFNIAQDRSESRNLAAANPQKLGELLVAWRDYVRETGTLEIPNLANRPGYSNGAKYYEDLKYEATLVPRTAKP